MGLRIAIYEDIRIRRFRVCDKDSIPLVPFHTYITARKFISIYTFMLPEFLKNKKQSVKNLHFTF